MEFKILLYIVGIIIYFFYSGNKAIKKKKKDMEQGRSNTPAKKTLDQELREYFERTIEKQRPPQQYTQELDEEEPYYENSQKTTPNGSYDAVDSVPYVSAAQEYEQNKAKEMAEYYAAQKYSIETEKISLQDHINQLDKVMQKKQAPPSVGSDLIHEEGFDAQKAFVYSEIFRPKYVEQ
jgi:FtsZ-interacting cell division protein ZipA